MEAEPWLKSLQVAIQRKSRGCHEVDEWSNGLRPEPVSCSRPATSLELGFAYGIKIEGSVAPHEASCTD